MNKYSAMSIMEALVVFAIVGVLMVVAITTIVSDDIRVLPYIHSTMKNFPKINKTLAEECFNNGGCRSVSELPDDVSTYCTMLSDLLATSGPVHCMKDDDEGDSVTYDGKTYHRNFKLSNGVSFYNFVDSDWADTSGTAMLPYIDVYFDINGAAQPNRRGEDFFGIRIFKNGEVVPGLGTSAGNKEIDNDVFAYSVILDKPRSGAANRNLREQEFIDIQIDGETAKKLTFRQASCAARGNVLLNRYYGSGQSCSGISQDNRCSNAQSGSFCTIKLVKPSATGFFKVFEN